MSKNSNAYLKGKTPVSLLQKRSQNYSRVSSTSAIIYTPKRQKSRMNDRSHCYSKFLPM
ncbi:MAG: hypothetical protein ACFE8N_14915 [Promethearchaeota archaeon]